GSPADPLLRRPGGWRGPVVAAGSRSAPAGPGGRLAGPGARRLASSAAASGHPGLRGGGPARRCGLPVRTAPELLAPADAPPAPRSPAADRRPDILVALASGAHILALAAAIAYGTADFLGGLATRRSTAQFVVLASQLAGLAVLAPVVLLGG